MSLKNVTSPEKNISVLELHIDKAAFDDAVTKAYKKNVGKMNVPGFRKGKAPKSIIEKMYGAAVFYDDALDMLLPDLYASAVEEAKLEVVSRPEIDIVSIDENGVELTAKVYTKPGRDGQQIQGAGSREGNRARQQVRNRGRNRACPQAQRPPDHAGGSACGGRRRDGHRF